MPTLRHIPRPRIQGARPCATTVKLLGGATRSDAAVTVRAGAPVLRLPAEAHSCSSEVSTTLTSPVWPRPAYGVPPASAVGGGAYGVPFRHGCSGAADGSRRKADGFWDALRISP